ncbi:MAG TPA: hypothetical protein PKI32_10420, partial [Opitutales bacterium]|nr:hypothetical protein [Opitutales bacterium]
GTSSNAQREWAESRGWVVRQFRMNWENATALIARGVPFAFSQRHTTSAHMQALVGFDRTRGVFLVMDPGSPYRAERIADALLEAMAPSGAMGIVFIPRSEAGRLDGLELTDAEKYDLRHEVLRALDSHDRGSAVTALQRMEQLWPDDSLTVMTRLSLAYYDTNDSETLFHIDSLLERYPRCPFLVYDRLLAMRNVTPEARIRFLEEACDPLSGDPNLDVELANLLLNDAAGFDRAGELLRRASRRLPTDSRVAVVMADLAWHRGKYPEATDLYKYAATLEEFNEGLFKSWFQAARRSDRIDEALAFLEKRFARLGKRSAQPAFTLVWALDILDRDGRILPFLEEAMRLRPEDGSLMAEAAYYAQHAGRGDAAALLEKAKGRFRHNDWLRKAIRVSERRYDFHSVLAYAEELLSIEPVSNDAHVAKARALGNLKGDAAAVAHVVNDHHGEQPG